MKNDAISRRAAIRWVKTECNPYGKPTLDFESGKKVIEHLEQMPAAEPQITRCKDCIHKPKPTEDYKQGESDSGFEIEFPDYMCPLRCDDPYYSRLPKDDWFCGNAERRTDV